jgi:hypothetical protein
MILFRKRKLRKAWRRYHEAQRVLQSAVFRRDTRGQHEAFRLVKDRLHEIMRLENG